MDYAKPAYSEQEKGGALVAAMRYLKITQYILPHYIDLLTFLDLVNTEASQVRCSGFRGEHGKRCKKSIDKEELARALLGLQAYALDRSMDDQELFKALQNLSIHLLCKHGCQNDDGALKLGMKLYEGVLAFRERANVPKPPTETSSALSRPHEYVKVLRKWYDGSESEKELAKRVRALEAENERFRSQLKLMADVQAHVRTAGDANANSRQHKNKRPVSDEFDIGIEVNHKKVRSDSTDDTEQPAEQEGESQHLKDETENNHLRYEVSKSVETDLDEDDASIESEKEAESDGNEEDDGVRLQGEPLEQHHDADADAVEVSDEGDIDEAMNPGVGKHHWLAAFWHCCEGYLD